MKSHRGLSAVVGTVFLVAVVIGGLTYISSSLETMANFSEQLVVDESRQKEIQEEKFDLLTVDVVSGKLDATIKNTGQIPVKITALYLDVMDENDVVQKYAINKTISSGNSFNFFDEGIDIDVDATKGYTMKLISERGEAQTIHLNSASQESLDIRLIASPNRIPTGFSTTLMMVVVNNMSNNNPLVNLTPVEPTCNGICTVLDGPNPPSYDKLDPGDVAIFEWVYELSGDDDEYVTFVGALENGYPGNTDDATVTITSVESAAIAGESLVSLGFGQSKLVNDIFVLHTETHKIPPAANYQMAGTSPDTPGSTFVFDGAGDKKQWFSANVTIADTTISAGNWNASLRYQHSALPSGMQAGANDIFSSTSNGGHILHFEDISPSTGLYDSVQDPTCNSLVETGSDPGVYGAVYSSTGGVNGSGAYQFDGVNDYLRIDGHDTKKNCSYTDDTLHSIAGWFKATKITSNGQKGDRQVIFWKWDNAGAEMGGFRIELGDCTDGGPADTTCSTDNEHGQLFYRFIDDVGDIEVCKSDKPDGNGGDNYIDGEWHHFAAVRSAWGECKLYMDSVWKQTISSNADGHAHFDIGYDVYIGNAQGGGSPFNGAIDDIMFWRNHVLSQGDVNALFGYSYGYDATKLNFYINNATGVGNTIDVLAAYTNYGMKWSDPGHYTDKEDLWRGGNFTTSLPEVHLNLLPDANRLNFTISYASGHPLTLLMDDEDLDGTSTELSSYLQTPKADPELPSYYLHDRDNKVNFYAFNSVGEGVWFTYQGTRIVFNGTNGHYTGIVDTVDVGNGPETLDADTDSPFVDENISADLVFWHPQNTPKASQPGDPLKIAEGDYNVTVYLNGYDEDGTVFIRSIYLGSILVVD